MKNTSTKTTKKVITKKEPQVAELNTEVIAFLEERIADGGATTDHLQVMLDKLKPKEEPATF